MKTNKLHIHKKIDVLLWELVQRELKRKQTRFVDPFTVENILYKLKQQNISNYVMKKVVARPNCPWLRTNFDMENNKLAHL